MLKIDYIFFNVLITTRIATLLRQADENAPQVMQGVSEKNKGNNGIRLYGDPHGSSPECK